MTFPPSPRDLSACCPLCVDFGQQPDPTFLRIGSRILVMGRPGEWELEEERTRRLGWEPWKPKLRLQGG
eukprot:4487585-Heterocapsa_arctica.AAC.1